MATNPGATEVDLGAIQLFLGALDLGSVSKAALRSGLTQPSATARLTKLERQLGVRLLERGPTGSIPTDAGRALTSACAELLDAAHQLANQARDVRQSADTLRLAATRTVIDHALAPWLAEAGLDATRLEVIEHDTLGVAAVVRSGQATIGFCDGPAPPIGLRSEIVRTIELVAVVAPNHGLARNRRPLRRSSQLLEHDIVVRRAGSGTRDLCDGLLGPHDSKVASPDQIGRRIEVSSNAAARLAAVNGSGVAIVPADLVAADLAAGRLVRIVVRDLVLEQPVRLVWKGENPATPAARALRRATHALAQAVQAEQ